MHHTAGLAEVAATEFAHLGSSGTTAKAAADAAPAAAADLGAEVPPDGRRTAKGGKTSARKRKAGGTEGSEAVAASPRSSERLLFEGLRSALAEGRPDFETQSGGRGAPGVSAVAEAALAALPWLLSGYCTAIKSYRATLAAGKLYPYDKLSVFTLLCAMINSSNTLL